MLEQTHPDITTREAKDVSETHPKSGLLNNLFSFAAATVHRHTAHRTRGNCMFSYYTVHVVYLQVCVENVLG